jgi:hypothetical protein
MEKLFLKIARGALVTVIALSLLLTVIAAIYGAVQFFPSEQIKAPEISITLKDMTASRASASSGTTVTPSEESDSEKNFISSKECESVASKINQLSTQIGWDKKSNQVINYSTLQFETKNSVDYNESIDVNRFCRKTQEIIEEENAKLSPYIKHAELKSAYYANFGKLLDEMLLDVNRNKALSLDDPGRYYTVTAIEWFNEQFSTAVNDARDNAALKEANNVAKKVKGRVSLYMAGISFAFFFACCMTLVFIRIEVNTRELVEVIRAHEDKDQGESNGSDNPTA